MQTVKKQYLIQDWVSKHLQSQIIKSNEIEKRQLGALYNNGIVLSCLFAWNERYRTFKVKNEHRLLINDNFYQSFIVDETKT